MIIKQNPIREGKNKFIMGYFKKYEFDQKATAIYGEAERKMNSSILGIIMTIENHYPELSRFLGEMPETIPNEEKPEIAVTALKGYYDSLSAILNNYMLEHYVNAKRNKPLKDFKAMMISRK
jgi:hypothetical protein